MNIWAYTHTEKLWTLWAYDHFSMTCLFTHLKILKENFAQSFYYQCVFRRSKSSQGAWIALRRWGAKFLLSPMPINHFFSCIISLFQVVCAFPGKGLTYPKRELGKHWKKEIMKYWSFLVVQKKCKCTWCWHFMKEKENIKFDSPRRFFLQSF